MKKDGILYTVIFSFLITFAFVFLLALANEGTRDIVAKNVKSARQKAVLMALNVPFGSAAEAETLYGGVQITEKNGTPLYTFQKGGTTVYAKEFSGNGLWGTITGVLAVNAEMTETVGLEIIAHNETPGLGGRIDEPLFKDQFKGEKIKDGKITVTAGAESGGGKKDPSDGTVDGITGATRTSQSLDQILNREISEFKKLLGVNR
jgi:Na+-transporting NADH:ubiquinone oxidoreductase subunit C